MPLTINDPESIALVQSWKDDWCKFARDVLRANLDPEMEEILTAIQHNRRVSVCSGTARGKDYLASVASVCSLLLMPDWDVHGILRTAMVINTAPSDRQVKNIMMREIKSRYASSMLPVLKDYGFDSGRLTQDGVKFDMPKNLKGDPAYANIEKWYLLAFKSDDHNTEAWTGFHNDNVCIVVTEASGISKTIFDGIEGCLQGNSKLLLVWNPNNASGEAYNSARDPQYKFFRLSSFTAPNVINGKKLHLGEITQEEYDKMKIPGQVDFEWVDERVHKQGWTVRISKEEMDATKYDFEWLGEYYRPSDVFKIKVMGVAPETPDGKLIPLAWVEAAMDRWKSQSADGGIRGVDVAGLGRDTTVECVRKGNYVAPLRTIAVKKSYRMHMELASIIKADNDKYECTFVDTIGEGAGVYSRLEDLDVPDVYSYKNSRSAKGMSDKTGVYKFKNMRAYTHWAARDFLNPQFNPDAMLPYDEELKAQLTEIEYEFKDDFIVIEPKEAVKVRLGCSYDKADAFFQTFAPKNRYEVQEHKIDKNIGYFFQ